MASRLAIMWMRFGPYHLARLRGAAGHLRAHGFRVTGLEVAGKDHYGWEKREGSGDFDRVTVFSDADYGDISARQIKREVRGALNNIDPDAVAINGWGVPEARAAVSWCRKNDRVAVLMSETKEDECPRTWWKEWLKSWIVRKFDSALVGGTPHKDYVVKLGIPEDRVFLGYDVVDNDYFSTRTEQVRARACHSSGTPPVQEAQAEGAPNSASLLESLKAAQPYFYANTRFLPRKNMDGLLRAYSNYRSRVQEPWNLIITGNGEEWSRLVEMRSELGLSEAVHFPGFVSYEELPAYYGLASAFIHPARSEPWGLVVNEACASRLPVLVSRTVGSRYELVRDRENGYLFDPFDAGDITEKMVQLASLPEEERAQMGRRSSEIVDRWAPERFAQGLRKAIDAGMGG